MKKFSGEKMIIVAVTTAFLVLIGASVWKATDADDLEKGSVTASPTENTQYDDSTESNSYDEDETEDFYVSTSTPTPTNYSYGSSKKNSSAKKNSSTKSSSKKSNPYKNYAISAFLLQQPALVGNGPVEPALGQKGMAALRASALFLVRAEIELAKPRVGDRARAHGAGLYLMVTFWE